MSSFLIVSAEFLRTGGQDHANYALASYLARHGHQVHLVAHAVDGDLLAHENLHWQRAPKPLDSTLLGEPLLDRIGRSLARRLVPRGARVIVNGGNCRCADVNWVHYVHSTYRRQTAGLWRSLRYRIAHRRFVRGETRIVPQAKIIIANSAKTARDLVDRVGVDPATVRVVYYGIDPKVFRPAAADERASIRNREGWSAHRPVILFIGAMGDRRKGFEALYAAFRILCADSTWNADLCVIGHGGEVRRWQARSRRDALHPRVRFLGFRDDVPNLLRAADLLVAPTRYEAYGLAVHEAICCAVPALVSARAGVAERFPRQLRHLLLPDPDNVEELAWRMRNCIASAESGRAALERFASELRARTWDDMAAEFLTAIDPHSAAGHAPHSSFHPSALQPAAAHDS